MLSFSMAAPKGMVPFHSNKSVGITRQRKIFWVPCLVHVPICMHKISILICGIVAVFINTQFTNTSARFPPPTKRFFFPFTDSLSQSSDAYKTLDTLHMTFAAGEMRDAKPLFVSFHKQICSSVLYGAKEQMKSSTCS